MVYARIAELEKENVLFLFHLKRGKRDALYARIAELEARVAELEKENAKLKKENEWLDYEPRGPRVAAVHPL